MTQTCARRTPHACNRIHLLILPSSPFEKMISAIHPNDMRNGTGDLGGLIQEQSSGKQFPHGQQPLDITNVTGDRVCNVWKLDLHSDLCLLACWRGGRGEYGMVNLTY